MFKLPKKAMPPYKTAELERETVPLCDLKGRVSAETIIDFPPSVPIVCEGEIIDEAVLKLIKNKTVECVKYEF